MYQTYDLLQIIKSHIDAAEGKKNKLATFQFNILAHATDLADLDSREFCEALDLPKSYLAEFGKMLRLASLIRDQGSWSLSTNIEGRILVPIDEEVKMTKMDMVWVSTARLIYPNTSAQYSVSFGDIRNEIDQLFHTSVAPSLITTLLLSSADRYQYKKQPNIGGSRNRYVFRVSKGRYRLYKTMDKASDGRDKTGPTNPSKNKVHAKYRGLVSWYEDNYLSSN